MFDAVGECWHSSLISSWIGLPAASTVGIVVWNMLMVVRSCTPILSFSFSTWIWLRSCLRMAIQPMPMLNSSCSCLAMLRPTQDFPEPVGASIMMLLVLALNLSIALVIRRCWYGLVSIVPHIILKWSRVRLIIASRWDWVNR